MNLSLDYIKFQGIKSVDVQTLEAITNARLTISVLVKTVNTLYEINGLHCKIAESLSKEIASLTCELKDLEGK